jgi:CRISPR-associated protein Cas5t
MEETEKVLKIKISLPSAQFRYPFTYQKRYSYPIPPYSTVLGFLTNLFNPEREKPLEEIKQIFESLEIAVSGEFETKTVNQYWFRNLSKKAHEKRFHSPKNRYWDFQVEHPGGQSPIKLEVLRNVKVFVYLRGDKDKLKQIERRINEELGEVIETPHLGRAEDFISDVEAHFVELRREKFFGKLNRYFWIPAEVAKELGTNRPPGLLQKIPLCLIQKEPYRIFKFQKVYLNDGLFTPYTFESELLIDPRESQPVFFAKISCPKVVKNQSSAAEVEI